MVDGLVSAVDAACDVDPGLLGDGETLMALHRQLARLEAVTTRATAAFDVFGGTWEADGARSAASWVAVRCRLPASDRPPPGAPGAGAAPHARDGGGLGGGGDQQRHAAPLAAARTPMTADAFERVEGTLAAEAKRLTYQRFMRVLAYWC